MHIGAHSQAFDQDVTLRMCERRSRIDQASLHPFLDEGMIARQLCELSFPIEIGAAISQVGNMSDRCRCRRDGQGDEGCAHPFQVGFCLHEVMESPVGARHEVCHEFSGGAWVFTEPGCSLLCRLLSHGYSGLGCDISCRVPTHPVCHDPDAAVIEEGQRILVRLANMPDLGATDSGPLQGLCHSGTSAGSRRRAGGNPTDDGPNRATI